MEHEKKSMNVDEEELEEGKAKEGEPLAKKYGYAEGTQQSAGVSVPQRSAAGGSTASSNAPAMFKSISDARDGLSKGVGRTSSEAPMTSANPATSSEQTQSPFTRRESPRYKKATKKSIEYTHGDQMKKGFSIGGTCGLCKRISKSITENVCEGCQSSMNTTQWHTSHLG